MARPLSEGKRIAILEAAAETVASLGIGATTAKIARGAGVAEGTLFTYFASKDELLNQLYVALKVELRDATMAGYPADRDVADRLRHIWERYVGWGSAHPDKLKAMRQLAVSDRITEESRTLAGGGFEELQEAMRECTAGGGMKRQPASFAWSIMSAIADAAMDHIAREPARAKEYTRAGFEAFWRAVAG